MLHLLKGALACGLPGKAIEVHAEGVPPYLCCTSKGGAEFILASISDKVLTYIICVLIADELGIPLGKIRFQNGVVECK